MSESKGITVESLKTHSFNGKEYEAGAKYTVVGDGSQTAEQYLETLKAIGFAKVVGEDSPAIIDEVGSPEEHAAKAKADASAQKVADDAAAKKGEPAEKKVAKDHKSTSVKPLDTESMKAEATAKHVEHRKPAHHVPTVKK